MRGKESRDALLSWSVCVSNLSMALQTSSDRSLNLQLGASRTCYAHRCSHARSWARDVCDYSADLCACRLCVFLHFLPATQAAPHLQPLSNYCQSGLERMLLQWRRSERRHHNEEVVLCSEQAIVLRSNFHWPKHTKHKQHYKHLIKRGVLQTALEWNSSGKKKCS